MGVPKFYRWLSERYPKINQVITDAALLPEFDHLYLDMNGIIHGCTHPNHLDVSDVLSERDMMLGIMHYLDRIITQIIRPKVSVFMAIDGVAPRAKLNQQRSRRFRSAKDMAEATKDLPTDDRGSVHVFDSNCITPGTEFMAKVSDVIKYFIRKKIKEDPLWRGLKVIFSGHEVPGEGEHKIMQHIREMKSQPDYQPNTRHVMYGQDADLIMLGLVTHEPHFTLLREVVNFGFGQNSKNTLKTVMRFTKQSDFQLLHLSVLREYLSLEFCKDDPSADLERVIDDFVFTTFLVGNDFLPHMPTLDIGDGAFDLLFRIYREQRKGWGAGEYLVSEGRISNASRLEGMFREIGSVETEICLQKEKDQAVYAKKKRMWNKRDGLPEGPSDAELAEKESLLQTDYLTMIESLVAKHRVTGKPFVDGWKPATNPKQKDFKGRYYFEKLKLTPADIEQHQLLRKAYVEGLMWCLAYYYRGCISWGWFYPYHYGPMLSDLINLDSVFSEIKFDIGAPLKPFEQLMGCLPPASGALVPKGYRTLMTSPNSPIIEFYPQTFEVDMNGKRNPWEGVNILPFIDVDLLKSTIATQCPESSLTSDERRRNSFGSVFLYTYDPTINETVPSPNRKIGLTDIQKCNSIVSVFEQSEGTDLVFQSELVKGTQIPFPGFPSLNVLPIEKVELVPIGLNCFGSASKYPTMVLSLHRMPDLPPLDLMAQNILGKSLFINWPMMHEARVVAISDATSEIRLSKKKTTTKKFNAKQAEEWANDSESLLQKYMKGYGVPGSGGVNIVDVRCRLKLQALQGMKTNPTTGATKKVFGKEEADVPLQLALWQAPAPDPRFIERGPLTLDDRFPPNSNVLLTKGKYRGCVGSVVSVTEDKKVGVKVTVLEAEPPFGLAIARSVQESYVSSSDAAKLLKLHPNLLGKVAGTLHFQPGRYDLGLNLKYAEGLCVVGYTRKKREISGGKAHAGKTVKKAWAAGDSLLVVGSKRVEAETDRAPKIQWEYTPKAIRLVSMYRQKFPKLFAAIMKKPNEKAYSASMLGPKGEEVLREIRDWLNEVESAKLPRSPVSTEAMPVEAVKAVQKAADVRSEAQKKSSTTKELLVKIPPAALYREASVGPTDVVQASDLNNNESPELGDRIANLCANGVPFGARGTVVGIHDPQTGCVEVVMDEEFIGGGNLQGACANFRGKLCIWAHLLKISPANSKALVDKLVPKGSGKAAVERIIASVRTQGSGTNGTGKKAWDTEVQQPNHWEKTAPVNPVSAKAAEPPQKKEQASATAKRGGFTPPRSQSKGGTSSTGRYGSSGRGKQGAWREAVGPDDKGKGFKGGRRKKGQFANGFAKWKALTSAPKEPEGVKVASKKTADLKAILGVSTALPQPPVPPPASALDKSAGLKALLGVGTTPQPPPVPIPPPPMPHFPPVVPIPQAEPTAAEKLLRMMQKNPPQAAQPMMPPPQSSFNFAYVEEGKPPNPSVAPTYSNHQPMPLPPQPMMMMVPPPPQPSFVPSPPPPPPQPKQNDS